jgi:hypothetical protein
MNVPYTPLTEAQLREIKKGDTIERMIAFTIPVYIIVQEVTDTTIDCGWIFDRRTGVEIDEDISAPVSYIRRVLTEEQKELVKKGEKLPYP